MVTTGGRTRRRLSSLLNKKFACLYVCLSVVFLIGDDIYAVYFYYSVPLLATLEHAF